MKESMAEAVALFSALDSLEPALAQAVHLAIETLLSGYKILVCCTGGSACEAQHLAGELVGRYKLDARALAAIALDADGAMSCRPRWRSHIAAGRWRASRAASVNERGQEAHQLLLHCLMDGIEEEIA
jgi:hypothetical protein